MRYKQTCPACGYSYEGIRADEEWLRNVYRSNEEIIQELLVQLKTVKQQVVSCFFCFDISTKSKTLMKEEVLPQ